MLSRVNQPFIRFIDFAGLPLTETHIDKFVGKVMNGIASPAGSYPG